MLHYELCELLPVNKLNPYTFVFKVFLGCVYGFISNGPRRGYHTEIRRFSFNAAYQLLYDFLADRWVWLPVLGLDS